MIETPEPEIDIDYSKIAPTEEQMEIAIKNCRLVYDPQNQMERSMLFEYLDNGVLQYGKITMMSFIINTADELMKGIENKQEGEVMIKVCCDYFNSPYHCEEHRMLSARIFDVILSPVPLFDNSAFIQIWCDLLEISFSFKEYEIECINNNFDPYNFPNNITVGV